MVQQPECDRQPSGDGDEAGHDQAGPPARGGAVYEVRIKGYLNSAWSTWLEGLQVQPLENGETVLTGVIVDQSALMGLLTRLVRLNLTLLSVNEMKGDRNGKH